MKPSKALVASAKDGELAERVVALAAAYGKATQQEIETNIRRVVSVDITIGENKTSIAELYAVAQDAREKRLRTLPDTPGSPAGVSDEAIVQALKELGLTDD